jgi:DNA polymerase V
MSARVREIFADFAPRVEAYSIDEAFLDLGNIAGLDLMAHGREMRRKVREWTGIPVGVGIGPTKTLAKAANRLAKKNEGVFTLFEKPAIRAALAGMAVEDIWGVGFRWGRKLRRLGVGTALALFEADPRMIRKGFSVVLQRTALELRGVSCIEIEEAPPPKKQIVVSRAFGKKITALRDMREGVSFYVTRAAEKLRREGLVARTLTVFLHTNQFSKKDPQYSNAATVRLAWGTDDTGVLIRCALRILERIFRPGFRYHKAGVMLMELGSGETVQESLFKEPATRRPELMHAIDSLNRKIGRGAVRYGAEGFGSTWRTKAARHSPRYTTRWEDLPRVRAG